MNKFELIERTKKFAVRVFKLVEKLPQNTGSKVISYQVLKSASSVAANYRAACRGKSRADFINKMKIVEEEADESLFWLELIKEVIPLQSKEELEGLTKEAKELVAIYTQALKTIKAS